MSDSLGGLKGCGTEHQMSASPQTSDLGDYNLCLDVAADHYRVFLAII